MLDMHDIANLKFDDPPAGDQGVAFRPVRQDVHEEERGVFSLPTLHELCIQTSKIPREHFPNLAMRHRASEIVHLARYTVLDI